MKRYNFWKGMAVKMDHVCRQSVIDVKRTAGRSILVIVALFLLLLSGCGDNSKTSEQTENNAGSDDYHFIFVCPILENEYWVSCVEGIRNADSELGTSTLVIGPQTADNFDVEIVDFMQQAVEAKPDGIIIYAGIEALAPLIEQAVAEGIPVFAIDTDAPDTSRVAFLGTDLYNFGYQAGQKMVELTGGTAKIGYICTSFSAQGEITTFNAFKDAIHDYEDMTIVAEVEGYCDPDMAEEAAGRMLEEHPEITAVYCTGGYNVTGAARVKEELGLDDLIMIGPEETEENIAFVRNGVINALLLQSPKQMGYQGVYRLKEYLDNGSLNKTVYDTGSFLVTKDNVDFYDSYDMTAIESGKLVRIGYYSGDSDFQDGFEEDQRKSGYAYEYYQKIASLTGWRYEYVYGTRTEIVEMLLAGEVDIVAGIYQTDSREGQVLFSSMDMGLEDNSRYFAVNRNRQDLLVDLDYAMDQIRQYSPDFSIMLRQKYYSHTVQQVLTNKETEWLQDKGILHIGYVRHNLPFSDQGDDGNPTGMVKELISLMSNYLQVEIEATCYENITELQKGLSEGEIDAAFPIYSDLWMTENNGFRQTDSIISDRVMLVYRGSYTSDMMDRVGLCATGVGQRYYMNAYYPDSELVFYDSREDVFNAIVNGEERCIIGSSYILQRFLREHPEYQNLNISYLDNTEDFGMAVTIENSILAGILNKAIHHLDNALITSIVIQYSGIETEPTLKDIFQSYAFEIILILILFFAILLAVFIAYRRKTNIFNAEQKKSRHALEEALDTAKKASEAKTVFLSTMSHDIRTPMNAIVGMTTIASNNMDNKERLSDCLNKINLSSHHLLTLINNVLDISKIESGKLTLNPAVFSIKDAMTVLHDIVQPQVKDKEIDLSISVHDLKYEMIYADEVRINQIFINILTNSIKYTEKGGKVIVDLTQEVLPEGDKVRLTYVVKDNGIGMSQEFMDHMYDTFSRAKDSRIDKIQGTGLGLSIVKQMVDMMGGSIECESKEGEGTTFTVRLELSFVEKDIEKASSESEQDISLTGLHLLVAEDNDLNWEVIEELLGMYGITAERAENGRVCADKVISAKEGTYDLILMDIQMPVMNGKEAARKIRENDREDLKRIPIIALTADAFAEDIALCMEAGMNGHAAKPVEMVSLCQEMLRVLSEL